jgi:predicted amino acid dehydrogenase
MDLKHLRATVGLRMLTMLGLTLLALGAFWAVIYRLGVMAVAPAVIGAAVIVLAVASRAAPPR